MHEIRIYSDCKLLIAHFATPPKLPLFPFSKWQSCLSLSALPRLHVYDVPYIVIRIASFRQRTNERKKKKKQSQRATDEKSKQTLQTHCNISHVMHANNNKMPHRLGLSNSSVAPMSTSSHYKKEIKNHGLLHFTIDRCINITIIIIIKNSKKT